MHRSTLIFLFVLTILAGLLGYNYFAQPFAEPKTQVAVENLSPSPSPSPDLVAQLSPAEQVRQLVAPPLSLEEESQSSQSGQLAQLTWIKDNQPGAVLLFGSKISSSAASVVERELNQIKVADKFSPLLMVDHEGGSVQRLSGAGFTQLPSWRTMCGLSLEERKNLLLDSSRELAAVGVDVVLGPVVDLASQSGSLGTRTCGNDLDLVAERAREWVAVYKAAQILPVIKHFPGIGEVNLDLHYNFANAEVTADDLQVFKEILNKEKQLGVMSTHVGVVGSYEDEPCSLNEDCLSDLTEYFYGVLTVTDALDMKAAGYGDLSLAERAVEAVKAGNNLLTFGPKVKRAELEAVLEALEAEYESDPEFAQQVKASIKTVWRYQEQFDNEL